MTFVPPVAGGSAESDAPHESKTRKYTFQDDARVRLLTQFAPRGIWPEVINGRAAQLGFFAAILTELLSGGEQTIMKQLQTPSELLLFVGTVMFTVIASLPPAFKGVKPSDANAGIFNAKAELANGRLAALGVVLAVLLEAKDGTPVIHQNPVQFIIPF